MARSFDSLPAVTSAMASRMDGIVSKLAKKAAQVAGRVAVESTRVDTGKARSNWRAQLNSPPTGTIPPYAPGNKLGKGERANAIIAMAKQRSVIGTFDVRRHQSIYISNSVEYIGILNDGRAGLSPDQMIQKAVQAAKVSIMSERILQTLVPKGGIGKFS